MVQRKKILVATLSAAAAIFTLQSAARAQGVYTENGDAGQTLLTAANAGSSLSIMGTLSSQNDADLYQISITTAGKYTFSTDNPFTTADTELSLFTGTGAPVLLNDDISGTNSNSAFTADLQTGSYFLGVAGSGNEPVNSANQLLFAQTPSIDNGDTTAVRGPNAGASPAVLSDFNSGSQFDGSGTYGITITAVPEPSTWAALALGGIASGFTFLRRRRTA